MNKFGINVWNWVVSLDEDVFPYIERAANMGFTAIELPLMSPEIPNSAALKAELDRCGMAVSMCVVMGAERDLSSFDPDERKRAKEFLSACFKTAEYFGARVLAGPLYARGGKRHHLAEDQRRREWDLAVEGLKEMAAIASRHGVTLALEPLQRYRSSVINTAQQALRMVDDIGHDNVGILFDTFHANIEEYDPLAALEAVLKADKLEHFHACGNNRGAPGTGHIAWEPTFDLLKRYGYRQHITMETFCDGGMDQCFYPLAASQDELARTGVEYLKSVYA